MANYKLTPNIEFDDNYLQAKKDVLTMLNSFDKLNPKQKECLIKEVIGAAKFDAICKVLNLPLK